MSSEETFDCTEKVIGPAEEAKYLLGLYDGKLSSCLEFLKQHFNVIQARSQLLLTICTLALTITGFSGPQIVQTNLFARYSMVLGIVFVLAAMLILLLGGLRIRWVSQMTARLLRQPCHQSSVIGTARRGSISLSCLCWSSD